jgi:hypothetical protein
VILLLDRGAGTSKSQNWEILNIFNKAWLLLFRADRRGIAMTGTRQTIEPESPEMGKQAGSFLMT